MGYRISAYSPHQPAKHQKDLPSLFHLINKTQVKIL